MYPCLPPIRRRLSPSSSARVSTTAPAAVDVHLRHQQLRRRTAVPRRRGRPCQPLHPRHVLGGGGGRDVPTADDRAGRHPPQLPREPLRLREQRRQRGLEQQRLDGVRQQRRAVCRRGHQPQLPVPKSGPRRVGDVLVGVHSERRRPDDCAERRRIGAYRTAQHDGVGHVHDVRGAGGRASVARGVLHRVRRRDDARRQSHGADVVRPEHRRRALSSARERRRLRHRRRVLFPGRRHHCGQRPADVEARSHRQQRARDIDGHRAGVRGAVHHGQRQPEHCDGQSGHVRVRPDDRIRALLRGDAADVITGCQRHVVPVAAHAERD